MKRRVIIYGWLGIAVCLLSFSVEKHSGRKYSATEHSGQKFSVVEHSAVEHPAVGHSGWKYSAVEHSGEGRHIVTRGPVPQLVGQPYIIIDKSDYELRVYDEAGWFGTYPAVFGNKSLGDKMMEGDRKTPEGEYKIVSKRPHEKWNKIMLINYPTGADWKKFRERKAKGLIPAGASIGGGIGIHGTWNRDEMAVDYYQNWTNGCISVKNEEMNELYAIIPVGTKVIIQK